MKYKINFAISKIGIALIIFCIAFQLQSISAEAGGGGGGGGGSSPPPPCQIKSSGCYRSGDSKAGFGELSPIEFSYYLPENKCKKKGSCDCGSTPSDTAEEKNPDDSNGACSCIAGTDWNAKAKCCGDDDDDCGKISSGVLCSIDANLESA